MRATALTAPAGSAGALQDTGAGLGLLITAGDGLDGVGLGVVGTGEGEVTVGAGLGLAGAGEGPPGDEGPAGPMS
jgi:hypothetical protein